MVVTCQLVRSGVTLPRRSYTYVRIIATVDDYFHVVCRIVDELRQVPVRSCTLSIFAVVVKVSWQLCPSALNIPVM